MKPRGIVASVTHGFATVPAEIVAVVCSMVARQMVSPAGIIREQAGAVSASYSQTSPGTTGGLALMAHEKADLDPYRVTMVR